MMESGCLFSFRDQHMGQLASQESYLKIYRDFDHYFSTRKHLAVRKFKNISMMRR